MTSSSHPQLAQAIKLHEQGKLQEAKALFEALLQSEPDNAEALHRLGILHYQGSNVQTALSYLRRAIAIHPQNAHYQSNLGTALMANGQLQEAIQSFQNALQINPQSAEYYCNLGLAYQKTNQLEMSLAILHKGLNLNPNSAEIHVNLGLVYQSLKRPEEVLQHYRQALAINPAHPLALLNLGNFLTNTGKPEEALQCYQQAIQASPRFPQVYNNLGVVQKNLGRREEAKANFKKAIELDGRFAEAYFNLAVLQRQQGQIPEAMRNIQKTIELQPNQAAAYNEIGLILKDQIHMRKAIAYFQKAIELAPNNALYHNNLGDAYLRIGDIEKSIQCYDKALKTGGTDGMLVKKAMALPPLYQSREDIEYWRRRFEENILRLQEQPVKITNPPVEISTIKNFYLAYHGHNDRMLQEQVCDFLFSLGIWETAQHQPNTKPRIGFISKLFKPKHTIGKLFLGILEHLSREKFDVFMFTFDDFGPSPVQTAHTHISLPTLDHETCRRLVTEQNLDILFYPDIGMDPSTYFLAFNRLAPIQCVSWGHPATTGIKTIDYFISSDLIEPEDAQDSYTEKLVRLNTLPSYFYRPQLPTDVTYTRADYGLTDEQHVYLCPQALFKMHPDFDEIIHGILSRDPQALVVMVNIGYPEWEAFLKARLTARMPEEVNRIRFFKALEHPKFLSLISLGDVCLDPLHFGGGRTTYESLAMGTPIVTMPSSLMRGRVTHGCYRKMGVLNCVADSPQAYVDIAVRLGTDPDYRAMVKEKILATNHVLFEDKSLIAELEDFFMETLHEKGLLSQFPLQPDGVPTR